MYEECRVVKKRNKTIVVICASFGVCALIAGLVIWDGTQMSDQGHTLRNSAAATRLRLRTTLTPDQMVLPTTTVASTQAPAHTQDTLTMTQTSMPAVTQISVPTADATASGVTESRSLVRVEPAPASDTQVAQIQTGLTVAAAQMLVNDIAPEAQALRPVELVIFRDVPCYEFVLDQGTLYIAQSDGTVLYNGIEAMSRAQQLAALAPTSALMAAPVVGADEVSVDPAADGITPTFTATLRPTVPTTTNAATIASSVLTPVSTPIAVPTSATTITPCATDANGNAVYCGAIPPADGPRVP